MPGRHVLDDPAWWALTGPLAAFATGAGTARRSSPVHSFVSATDPAAPEATAARDLTALLAAGERTVLVGRAPLVPAGCTELGRGTGDQMVLDDVASLHAVAAGARGRPGNRALSVVTLGPDDAEEMRALVGHARPGPFFEHTHELGTYVGVCEPDGRLVALAGERLRLPGYVEISAVSTHETRRRRGLASIVVAEVATRALARGDQPYLHVAHTNAAARPVYERLGFRRRCDVAFVSITAG